MNKVRHRWDPKPNPLMTCQGCKKVKKSLTMKPRKGKYFVHHEWYCKDCLAEMGPKTDSESKVR